MSASIDEPVQGSEADLADELHHLEEQEANLERRTRSVELMGPLALVFALLALAGAAAALAVALTHEHTGSSVSITAAGGGNAPRPTMMGSTAQAGGMMMGVGNHGKFDSSQVAAAAKGTVYVQLGDIWVAPAVSTVKAGKVVFKATNVGKLTHELMVERLPMKFDAPMQPNEDAAQGMIPDMDGGASGQMTMHLRPGKYMLFCNVEGHYMAGQHMVFRVAKA